MAGSWQALITLGHADRLRLLASVLGLPIIHGLLAVAGYGRVRRWLEQWTARPGARAADARDLERARALARLVAIAGRRGAVEATCLRQSLLLFAWLRRRGLRPTLQLGVADRTGGFQAHAWVELEGHALLQRDAGYRPFVSPSRGQRAG